MYGSSRLGQNPKFVKGNLFGAPLILTSQGVSFSENPSNEASTFSVDKITTRWEVGAGQWNPSQQYGNHIAICCNDKVNIPTLVKCEQFYQGKGFCVSKLSERWRYTSGRRVILWWTNQSRVTLARCPCHNVILTMSACLYVSSCDCSHFLARSLTCIGTHGSLPC